MDLDKYTSEKATHELECSHFIGDRGYYYKMNCTIIPSKCAIGRVKIVLFGERNWKDKQHIKSVRYVESYRVKRKQQ